MKGNSGGAPGDRGRAIGLERRDAAGTLTDSDELPAGAAAILTISTPVPPGLGASRTSAVGGVQPARRPSRRGLTLYPASAFLGLFLSLAAAISFRRDRRRLAASPVPVYGAVLMSAAGLLVTAKAAPNMLRLRRLASDDEAGLRQALSGFHFWSAVRGAFQVLGFVANVWSLATIGRDSPRL